MYYTYWWCSLCKILYAESECTMQFGRHECPIHFKELEQRVKV